MDSVPNSNQNLASKFEKFLKFVWNSETEEFLGRTWLSWVKILSFFVVFYAVLYGYFSLMMEIAFTTISKDYPKWQMGEGLIGTTPGLTIRPLLQTKKPPMPSIFRKLGDSRSQSVKFLLDELDEFLKIYKNPISPENIEKCDYGKVRDPEKVCGVDLKVFGPCNSENYYGYTQGSLCVFLKLNRIYNWKPEIYNDPKEFPQELNNSISISNTSDRNIWVTCKGEKEIDRDRIGDIEYYPSGFPEYYYPFTNKPGYLSPLVAVQFKNVVTGIDIKVECKAWAKNIVHNWIERRGVARFKIITY